MTISGKVVEEIVVTGADGEVLAVISDGEIVEKEGISVLTR